MSRRFYLPGLLAVAGLGLAVSLANCAGENAADGNAVSGVVVAADLSAGQETDARSLSGAAQPVALMQGITPTPTSGSAKPEETPRSKLQIRVWWPEEFYPQAGSEAESILLGQFEGFTRSYSTYELDVRRKRSGGVGGILPTLRTAQPVAPGAIPDMTLMRRSDMVTAATEGLIVPITDWAPEIDSSLDPEVITLGMVKGTLYGVPYALNLHHVAYRESMLDEPLLTFDDVLARHPLYLFPAGPAQGALTSWTVLLQYWAAGGRLADADSNPMLDVDALMAVLEYYERGVEQDIFAASLLDQSEYEANWSRFVSGEAAMIGIDSTTYLSHVGAVQNVGLAPLPTQSGAPITALNGWMWVLTTRDPDRQDQARAFLSWMMRVGEHAAFSEAMGILPSQDRALRLWDNQDYATFAQTMITEAQEIPSAQGNNRAAAALQASVAAVLGGVSAQDAAEDAIDSVAQP